MEMYANTTNTTSSIVLKRTFYIKIDNDLSKVFDIRVEGSQSSVLSPMLYI